MFDRNGDITVYLGLDNLNPENVFKITKKIIYPYYSQKPFEIDIGLLKLERKVKFSKSINPICISKENMTGNENYQCVLTGFSKTSRGKKKMIK